MNGLFLAVKPLPSTSCVSLFSTDMKKQTKQNNSELFLPSVCHHRFPSSSLELLPNLTGPLRNPLDSLRTGLTSPTHVSCQLWPLEEQAEGKEVRKRWGLRWRLGSVVWKLHVNTLSVAQFPRTWSTMAKRWGTERGYIYIVVKQKLKYCRRESL